MCANYMDKFWCSIIKQLPTIIECIHYSQRGIHALSNLVREQVEGLLILMVSGIALL